MGGLFDYLDWRGELSLAQSPFNPVDNLLLSTLSYAPLDHLVDRLEAKAHLKGRKVTKYKYLGLMLFVAMPLPGTGAWTGALAAAFLDMPLRKALPSIFAGVLIAGFLILGLTYGFTSLF